MPAAALGLYSGRVLSELYASHLYFPINWAIPLVITAVTLSLAILITKPHPLRETWPLLFLYIYVVYGEADPLVWVGVGVVTAVCLAQAAGEQAVGGMRANGRWLMAGGLGLVMAAAGGLYLLTLSPGLLPADNGEFQLVAARLGVAHPPGFPLYTLLAHLMTRLPIGATAAYRVNVLSVLSSTAVLLLVYVTVHDLTQRHLAAATAVIALGTATTFWSQATTANIRSLTALFTALALWALVRFYQTATRQKPTNKDHWLVVLALALSLGITHHLSLAFMGGVFLITVVVIDPSLVRTPHRWGRPLLAALAGLLPLLYLPLRAGADVRGASEQLATPAGFLRHFLGLGFQGDFFYFIDPLVLSLRLGVMGNVMTFQFSPWLLLGMGIGLALLFWREWKLGLLLGGAFALHTLVTAMYRAPQTVEYMLPAYIPAVLCLGYGVGQLAPMMTTQRVGWLRPLALLFAALMFTATLHQGWQRWPSYWQLHLAEDANDYAQGLLTAAPPDAIILANWHWVTPLWYLQEVAGQRPDITVRYVAPGAEPYGQTWAQAISVETNNGRDVIATWYDAAAYTGLPSPEPMHEAFWFRQQPRTTLPEDFVPLTHILADNVQLVGYHLSQTETEIWQDVVLTLAWQPLPDARLPVSLYAHLMGGDGRSYAQSDQTIIPSPTGLTLTQFHLTPRPGTLPGSYMIRVGNQEAAVSLGTLDVIAMSRPPATQNRVYRHLVNGDARRLIGYDWDQTLSGQPRLYLHWQTADGYITETQDHPTAVPPLSGPWGIVTAWWPPHSQRWPHYVPLADGLVWMGESLTSGYEPFTRGNTYAWPQRFTTNRPILRDYVVSTRLVGYEADGFHWAWCDLVDYVPAMGAIPTLKWIAGEHITSPHLIDYTQESPTYEAYCQSLKPAPGAPLLAVAEQAVPGQAVGGTLVMYEAFSQRPLPILDERITGQFSWIPLGGTAVGE